MILHRLPSSCTQSVTCFSETGRHGSDRLARGDNHHREDQQCHGEGAGDQRAAHVHPLDKEHETEQTVDDRRHTGEVRNVHVNEIHELATTCIFFQVDGGAEAHHERNNTGAQHDPDRSPDGRIHTGYFRITGWRVGNEVPAQPAPAWFHNRVQQHEQ